MHGFTAVWKYRLHEGKGRKLLSYQRSPRKSAGCVRVHVYVCMCACNTKQQSGGLEDACVFRQTLQPFLKELRPTQEKRSQAVLLNKFLFSRLILSLVEVYSLIWDVTVNINLTFVVWNTNSFQLLNCLW